MLSCAVIIANFFQSAEFLMPGYSDKGMEFQINGQGKQPVLRKNGEYPVLSNLAELITNSIVGNSKTQLVCFSLTNCLII
jgi:hypothetical protein